MPGNNITNNPRLPAVISGNLNFGGNPGVAGPALRTISVAQFSGIVYGLIISANISGNVSLRLPTGGGLQLGGNNTYTGDTYLQGGTLAIGNDTALGTGMLSWGSILVAENGPRTIANVISVDVSSTFGGADDLTFTGAANLTGNRTSTVANVTFHSPSPARLAMP